MSSSPSSTTSSGVDVDVFPDAVKRPSEVTLRPDHGLNVLFVGPYPPSHGGTAVSLHQLTLALQERGHSVRVLAPLPADSDGFDDTFARGLGSVRLSRYAIPYFYYAFWALPYDEHYRAAEREAIHASLPALIEAERPDLIVAGHESLARLVPGIAAEHGLPCVLLVRGSPTWKIVSGDYPELEGREWLTAYARADRIVTVARYLARGLRTLGLTNVCSVPNHVDLVSLSPQPKDAAFERELDLDRNRVVALHASKLEVRKRPLDIVLSASAALRECPDLVYVVAGAGPLEAELEATSRRLGISERFRFPGRVPYERMRSLFGLADMVIHPSEGEGLARVYLEAMACERLLVASDIPPAREIIRHGENGLLFETGNVEALAQATVLAARDAALRARLGREARASIAAHSIDRVTDEFVAVFHDVLRTSQS